jgi:RHS repeat-associated protein
VTYGYDRVGNRVRETETTGLGAVTSDKTAVFDAFNRLVSVTDAVAAANSAAFTYDGNGNLRTKTAGGVTSTYVYDLRDKLVEAREGSTVLGRFQYDGDGRRSLKVSEFGVQQFVYDGTSLFEELDGSGVQQARYEWGSDRLISLFRTNEPRRYFSFDGLGSVVGLTDAAGASVAAYHLDVWGGFRFPAERAPSQNRFAFTGYYLDTETDLYYAKARYFDPDFGRFLTQDSYLGEVNNPPSLHRYFYAYANPTRYVDPTGHMSWDSFKTGAATFGSDLLENAGPRLVKIGASAAQGAASMVRETAANIADASVLTYELATGTETGLGMNSAAAQSAAARMGAGESAASVTADTLKETALGIGTFGTYGTIRDQVSAVRDYAAGRATVDQVEDRLANAAGGAVLNVGMTAAFMKATTGSVKGPDLGALTGTVVESATQLPGRLQAAMSTAGERLSAVAQRTRTMLNSEVTISHDPGVLSANGLGGVKVGLDAPSRGLRSPRGYPGVEPAADELIAALRSKGRTVEIARPGSEELRYLDAVGAEANVGGETMSHILLRQNPSKVAVLEEFLHGTQNRLGIIERLGVQGAEVHVKEFMLRHQRLLGIGEQDVQGLTTLLGHERRILERQGH